MPKTVKYQLRLQLNERAQLKQIAADRGLTVAEMIREDYGLSDGAVVAEKSQPEGQGPAGKNRNSVPVAEPEPSVADQSYADRVAELSRTMPRRNAQTLASRELAAR